EIPNAFSESGVAILTANRGLNEITASQEFRGWLGVWEARGQGLGGWDLEAHHAYDPASKVLYLGDGTTRQADTIGGVIDTVAGGSPSGPTNGDGGPATATRLNLPLGVAAGPDGSLYIAQSFEARVRRVDPDGILWTYAGTTPGFGGDGGPATEAQLRDPVALALGADGSLYIADFSNQRIRRVDPNGVITTFAGNGIRGFAGDNGPATEAQIAGVEGIAVAPDGSVYIADTRNGRVRRVRPGGNITTVAGTGAAASRGDDGPAREADLLYPSGIVVGPDGGVYISEYSGVVRRIAPDGIIRNVAGVVGQQGFAGDGMPAVEAKLNLPHGLALGADGNLFIVDTLN
ncbi:MAG: hypothetical protein L0227_11435, partial [Chloroflexi bacterium]|nr:hypothetical protein [Chloroflexota bacterium]